MRTPEEEQRDQRVLKLFEGMPTLDAMLQTLEPEARTTEWGIIVTTPDSSVRSQKYELQNGRVSVAFSTLASMEYLTWNSDKLGFMDPSRDMNTYAEFLAFSLTTLPSLLFGNEEEAVQDYITNGSAKVEYRSSPRSQDYSLNSEKDRVKLITELITRPKQIKTVTVNSKRQDETHKYWFLMNFYERQNSHLNLSIGVYRNESEGVWNPELSKWALSTHLDRDKLGNLDEAAANLSQAITLIKSK